MKPITRAQRKSLYLKWKQDNQKMSYRAFRRSARHAFYDDCLLVRWCGMTLGIEKDGYTHT